MQYNNWKDKVRSKLIEISGINNIEECSSNPQLIESIKLNGYIREKMIIQTEPGVWMPFYVLIPDKMVEDEKRPCIIAPHGHGFGGKYSVAGRVDIPIVKERIEEFNCDYGVQFVKEGYIVFCPEARGFGERREWTIQKDDEESFLQSSCKELNNIAICLGRSLTGMWVWDLMQLINYIETREDCNSEKIGCAGLSGGGLQTLWLAALDDRIKCAVVSGYFYGYKDSLLKLSNNCCCNYVPHLWEHVDMGDLGALIAPRAILIESGIQDGLNGERGIVNVTEQLEITLQAYKLYNAESSVYHHMFEGGHKWDGIETYKFVNKHLKGVY